jgi:XTP/dITP diphosphohydrolase
MSTIVIATHNKNKANEIAAIINNRYTVQTLADFRDAPIVKEDKNSFAENAKKKASEIAFWLSQKTLNNMPDYVLADDSGLEVDILNGKPGIHSARYASEAANENASDAKNNAKLLKKLAVIPESDRGAQFCCVLALKKVQQMEIKTFEGICRGQISKSETGKGGFGYDPLFIPDGYQKSFAELGSKTKNAISHRAKALSSLADFLLNSQEDK